jgi:hemerythrin-like metal-binding protein
VTNLFAIAYVSHWMCAVWQLMCIPERNNCDCREHNRQEDDRLMTDIKRRKKTYSSQYIIDHEHELIKLELTRLQEAIIGGKGLPAIFSAADALIARTLTHFRHEEKILAVVGYEGFSQHRAAHIYLLKEIQEIKAGLLERQITSALHLARFFSSSIPDHFELEDVKFEDAIRAAVHVGTLPIVVSV